MARPQKRVASASFWIGLALFVVTLAVYLPARHFDFVNYDDPDYVTSNPHIRGGVTPQTVAWAVTSGEAANWLPITRLSYLLDYQLFGMQSGWDHLVNAFIHALTTVFVFLFFYRATRARWPSAFVALLFALHPLHVESVAWISERKDVLSAFFWFLTLWFYVRYAERLSPFRLALVLAAFCLGLMSKPMVVTLPLVLLLLSFWPLRGTRTRACHVATLGTLLLAAITGVITYLVQSRSGAVKALAHFPLSLRIENALVSYAIYLGKMFWPANLAVFYPYPAEIPLWQPLLATAILIAISVFVAKFARSYPYLVVGWLWYLITLLPVIGLIQVGGQARADRYMYIPMTGIAIMLSWGAADIVRRWPQTKMAIVLIGVLACSSCIAVTSRQLQYWRNSGTLFEHALSVTHRNYVAQHNLGTYLLGTPDQLPAAISHFEEALQINPDSAEAHTDLGSALAKTGQFQDAVAQYQAALRINPNAAITHNDLGNALAQMPGHLPDAVRQYETALHLNPDFAEAHNNLGSAYYRMHRLQDAIAEYQQALRLNPD